MSDEEIMRLELLGRWDASIADHSIRIGLRQQRLLAALAVYGTRSRRWLCGLLWPECNDSRALGNLRATVFVLARRLPGAVTCQGTDLGLDERVNTDLHRLRQALDRPDDFVLSSADGQWLLDRHRAELLPGWYDDWVISEADRLKENYIGFLEKQAGAALTRGDPYEALTLARVARRLDPLRESTVGVLIRGHQALGDETTALREFRNHCTAVAQELGCNPSKRLNNLIHNTGAHPGKRSNNLCAESSMQLGDDRGCRAGDSLGRADESNFTSDRRS